MALTDIAQAAAKLPGRTARKQKEVVLFLLLTRSRISEIYSMFFFYIYSAELQPSRVNKAGVSPLVNKDPSRFCNVALLNSHFKLSQIKQHILTAQ